MHEENSGWRIFINLKYGAESEGWYSKFPRGGYGLGLWKEERRLIKFSIRVPLSWGMVAEFVSGKILGAVRLPFVLFSPLFMI